MIWNTYTYFIDFIPMCLHMVFIKSKLHTFLWIWHESLDQSLDPHTLKYFRTFTTINLYIQIIHINFAWTYKNFIFNRPINENLQNFHLQWIHRQKLSNEFMPHKLPSEKSPNFLAWLDLSTKIHKLFILKSKFHFKCILRWIPTKI